MNTRKMKVLWTVCSIIILMLYMCTRKTEYQKGVDALQKGDYANAIKSLAQALATDTLNPEIHLNLCLAYVHIDSVNQSWHHFLKLSLIDTAMCNNVELKEMYSRLLEIEPYQSHVISMGRMNQFKGTFNPDNKTIVVAAAPRDNAHIYLIGLDGAIKKKVTRSGLNTDPDISPNGEYIIFVSDVDGDDELYLYNIKTGDVEQLTNNKAQDFSPSFSPDGNNAVFVSNVDNPYKWEIYTINIKNKRTKHITKNQYWDGFPKYTPDGKSVVFSSKRNGSENIYIMKASGGGERLLYESPADDNDPILVGEELFFKSNRDGEWELYRYNIHSEQLLQLTYNDDPDWNPRISNDGTKLLVSRKTGKRWQLYLIDLTKPVATDVLIRKIEKRLSTTAISCRP